MSLNRHITGLTSIILYRIEKKGDSVFWITKLLAPTLENPAVGC